MQKQTVYLRYESDCAYKTNIININTPINHID
nr:MAG TPA: hypothetical protein [Caudoviricetes sp.]